MTEKPRLAPTENLYLDLLKKCLTASLYDASSWYVFGRNKAEPLTLNPVRLARNLAKMLLVKSVWLLGRIVSDRGWLVIKPDSFDAAKRALGDDWPLFGYTMIGLRRLDNIQACMEEILANNVPGDMIETGAWRGGATIFMRAVLKHYNVSDRTIWVADSFEGLPVADSKSLEVDSNLNSNSSQDINFGGEMGLGLAVSLEQVQKNFDRFDLLDDQVKFLKGWFKDTLPDAPIDKLSLLRLDGDLYGSTMDALNALYSKVSPGGYVLIDDYYTWPSCKQAVLDFRREHGINCEIIDIDHRGAYWQVR